MRAPLFLALAALPTLAAADPLVDTITPNNTLTEAPSAWLGDTPHLVMMGTTVGHTFDVQIMDLDMAEIHEIEVKREYLLTDTDYSPYQEWDFGIKIVLDGMDKSIEGKLTHADFNDLEALPASFNIQSAEEYPEGDLIFTEFEYEWEAEGISVNEELAEWSGTATMNLDGSFKADTPNGDGMIGGYINAVRGGDTIVISFTLPVTEFEVED